MFLKNGLDSCCYSGKCHNCGHDTWVSITRTKDGFGLLGGILYEHSPEDILFLCDACYGKHGLLAFNVGPDRDFGLYFALLKIPFKNS
jgi:hypothetical protein